MTAFVIVAAVIAFLLFLVAATSVRIVRPYQRGLVERLGKLPRDRRSRPAARSSRSST